MSALNIFVSITTGAFSERCRKFYAERGHRAIVSTLGHGTANSKLSDYLGLETSEKQLEFLPADEKEGKLLIREFRRMVHYEKQGSGIAFLMPVDGVGGKTILEFMMGSRDKTGQKEEKKQPDSKAAAAKEGNAEKPAQVFKYDLIIAVLNQGFTEEVMNAARSAGAGGGTVIHAKGTASAYSEKFFGITLSDEKEVIFIVTKKVERDKIMDAIKKDAGVSSPAHTILFSLPVEAVAGIASYE